jgi:lipopolysaccharide biosynthesis glycosyltransferase
MKVFVGYDTREDITYQVCEYSILKHQPNAEVIPLKQKDLRDSGIYQRSVDNLGSTEFTFTRFLVPYLSDYTGWAIFCDCDFLWTTDISELFDLADDRYAAMVVKHDYTPKEGVKMDGCRQLPYPRKNWSSLILWNCGHISNQKLDLKTVNEETGQYLHRFQWLKDEEIGSITHEWNWLVNWYQEPTDGFPKALHYTEGGPWFKDYRHCEYHQVWKTYLKDMLN